MKYYKLYVDNTNSFFTYLDSEEKYSIGDRVAVKFRNKERGALIVSEDKSESFPFEVLEISKKLENEISLEPKYIELLLWISNYYLCSFSQVLLAALPKELKIKYTENYKLIKKDTLALEFGHKVINYFLEKEKITKPTLRKSFSNEIIKELIENNIILVHEDKKLSFNFNSSEENLKKYNDVYMYFLEKTYISKKNLLDKFDEKLINRLVNKNYLEYSKFILQRNLSHNHILNQEIKDSVILSEEQEKVVNKIESSSKNYHLIKGITGSGKTEIYIQLIKNALREGKGSIFLVPEISLTPQMIKRFKKEFKEGIAVLHSNITDKEKKEEWLLIQKGIKKIVLGARSAIFAPIKDLKYIIIDEEHEGSYKQDSNPRYNAKIVALKRSAIYGAKVILGSATPSIESYYYGKIDAFNLITLDKRYNEASLPEINLIDMKQEENNFFSKELLSEIKNTLLKKEQVILLLNRKGYSTMVQCKDCGHIEECPHCSIKLSYYTSTKKLKCNYCGRESFFKEECTNCHSKNIQFSGKGTEQVEEKLKEYFNVPIIRVDSESSREKNFYENAYFDFLNKKYDIMIGTQMIAKGLHFPDVTLVGVINSDIILSFPDFRATEKTYQLITQVAGRAGRGSKKGKVIIQTYQPENYVMDNILNNNFEDFYNKEIELRKIFEYPPFSKIINIGISHTKEETLNKISQALYSKIKNDYLSISPPNKSLVYKVKDRYRKNIFIKGSKNNIEHFKKELKNILNNFDDNGCRIIVDIDPLNLI